MSSDSVVGFMITYAYIRFVQDITGHISIINDKRMNGSLGNVPMKALGSVLNQERVIFWKLSNALPKFSICFCFFIKRILLFCNIMMLSQFQKLFN